MKKTILAATIGISLSFSALAFDVTQMKLESDITFTTAIGWNSPPNESLRLRTNGTYTWRAWTGRAYATVNGNYTVVKVSYEDPKTLKDATKYGINLTTPGGKVRWEWSTPETRYQVIKTAGRVYSMLLPKPKMALRIKIID